jgi:Gram-negative bacterial TonB protein C-terminal
MCLLRSSLVTVLAFVAAWASAQDAPHGAPRVAAPASCHVTLPDGKFAPKLSTSGHGERFSGGIWYGKRFGGGFWYGTERLWTVLPRDGVWRGSGPAGPHDFAYSNKLPWGRTNPPFRKRDDPLTVTGERLDGPAPVFTETFESSGFGPDYSGEGIMGGMAIPVFGCWRITGRYKEATLSFTVWVAPPSQEKQSLAASETKLQPKAPASEAAIPRIFVDGNTQAKSLVYKVAPELPPDADAASIGGVLLLHAIIGQNGRPRELQYISGPPSLERAAIEAVKWWQYRVELVGDQVPEVDTTIEVLFPEPRH